MDTREAVARKIYELCDERGWAPNHLANVSAVPQATIKSILNGESSNPGIVTIKNSVTASKSLSQNSFPHYILENSSRRSAESAIVLLVFSACLPDVRYYSFCL